MPMTAAELTADERHILEQLLSGKTAKQVRDVVAPSTTAIWQRIATIKKRAGVRTLLQLGAWCERHGIREGQS